MPARWRYEFKYIVPRHVRTPLTADLRAFVDPDNHAGPDGYYSVRSLYLDSPDWRCFYDKKAGIGHRHKLRVRGYPDEKGFVSTVKFEVKYRRGSRIGKHVAPMGVEDYQNMLPLLPRRAMLDPSLLEDSVPMLAFETLKQTYCMTPVVNVGFRRQAFKARTDCGVRITLDDRLAARRARDLLEPMPSLALGLTAHNSILEVKIDQDMPFWMHQLIAKYRLQNTSVSKYCLAVVSGPFGLDGAQ